MRKRPLAAFASWIMSLALLGFYGACAYFLRLSYSSPTEPSAVTGHVIKFNNHGHLFYVRQEETWFFYGCLALLPLAIVTLILLQWRYGKAALDSPHRPSTFWKYLNGALFIALTIYMLWPLIGY